MNTHASSPLFVFCTIIITIISKCLNKYQIQPRQMEIICLWLEMVWSVAYSKHPRTTILTVNTDFDPLGNTRRHSVSGDAQISAHIQTRDARQFQGHTLPFQYCRIKRKREIWSKRILDSLPGARGGGGGGGRTTYRLNSCQCLFSNCHRGAIWLQDPDSLSPGSATSHLHPLGQSRHWTWSSRRYWAELRKRPKRIVSGVQWNSPWFITVADLQGTCAVLHCGSVLKGIGWVRGWMGSMGRDSIRDIASDKIQLAVFGSFRRWTSNPATKSDLWVALRVIGLFFNLLLARVQTLFLYFVTAISPMNCYCVLGIGGSVILRKQTSCIMILGYSTECCCGLFGCGWVDKCHWPSIKITADGINLIC